MECVYYEVITLHGYQWANFYDTTGANEYVLPLDKAKDMGLIIGEMVRGDCSGIMYHRTGDKTIEYFKLKESTVVKYEDIPDVEESGKETKDADGIPFLDYAGKEMERSAWYKRYGVCSHCTSDVEHTSLFKFTKSGDILCEECATTPEIVSDLTV